MIDSVECRKPSFGVEGIASRYMMIDISRQRIRGFVKR
jgi:hypothetical protein